MAALILIVIAAGVSLPKKHETTRTVTVSQPPEAVWKTITDYANQSSWREDVKKSERLADRNGNEVWLEDYGHGSLTLETIIAEPPLRLVRLVSGPGGFFQGAWDYRLSPEGSGTRVAITERGTVFNPIFRFVFRYIIRHNKNETLDAYLTDLGRKFGENVSPE